MLQHLASVNLQVIVYISVEDQIYQKYNLKNMSDTAQIHPRTRAKWWEDSMLIMKVTLNVGYM